MFIQDQRGAVLLAEEKGREEGREEGIEEGIELIVFNLLETLDEETIAKITKLPLATVLKIKAKKEP